MIVIIRFLLKDNLEKSKISHLMKFQKFLVKHGPTVAHEPRHIYADCLASSDHTEDRFV